MIQKTFSIFDVKARAYLPPFYMAQEGQATRIFKDCINDKSHQFGQHPEDYTLFYLGDFDDCTGQFETVAPELVAQGLALVEEETRPGIVGEVEKGNGVGNEPEIAERVRQKQVAEINNG